MKSLKSSPVLFSILIIVIFLLSLSIITSIKKISLINQALAAEINQSTYSHVVSGENRLVDCDCEKDFSEEKNITVEGQVIASFVSGTDLGIRNLDKTSEYQQFYVDASGRYQGRGRIRIEGRLIGVTCAYANSVFGECVPEIEAEKIAEIK